jgi:hypothetical protein
MFRRPKSPYRPRTRHNRYPEYPFVIVGALVVVLLVLAGVLALFSSESRTTTITVIPAVPATTPAISLHANGVDDQYVQVTEQMRSAREEARATCGKARFRSFDVQNQDFMVYACGDEGKLQTKPYASLPAPSSPELEAVRQRAQKNCEGAAAHTYDVQDHATLVYACGSNGTLRKLDY